MSVLGEADVLHAIQLIQAAYSPSPSAPAARVVSGGALRALNTAIRTPRRAAPVARSRPISRRAPHGAHFKIARETKWTNRIAAPLVLRSIATVSRSSSSSAGNSSSNNTHTSQTRAISTQHSHASSDLLAPIPNRLTPDMDAARLMPLLIALLPSSAPASPPPPPYVARRFPEFCVSPASLSFPASFASPVSVSAYTHTATPTPATVPARTHNSAPEQGNELRRRKLTAHVKVLENGGGVATDRGRRVDFSVVSFPSSSYPASSFPSSSSSAFSSPAFASAQVVGVGGGVGSKNKDRPSCASCSHSRRSIRAGQGCVSLFLHHLGHHHYLPSSAQSASYANEGELLPSSVLLEEGEDNGDGMCMTKALTKDE
ncbi:hypothetical protein C8R45DRAFT_1208629 [Mycena sanguinolenta]|nr:hypothetical protein C8R45DRAFT_1208629 [Mycena sanguinolenta]